jgi:hypothetical protein
MKRLQYKSKDCEILSWYDGELDVAYKGKRHHLRFAAFEHRQNVYNPGVWENEIVPSVGTIKGPNVLEYPSDDAVAAIKDLLSEGSTVDFSTFVPARWNDDEKRIEKQGS